MYSEFRVLHNCFWTNLKDTALSCFFLRYFSKVWGDHHNWRVWHWHRAALIAANVLFLFGIDHPWIFSVISFCSSTHITHTCSYGQRCLSSTQLAHPNSAAIGQFMSMPRISGTSDLSSFPREVVLSGYQWLHFQQPSALRSNWSEHLPQPPSRKRCSPQFCV